MNCNFVSVVASVVLFVFLAHTAHTRTTVTARSGFPEPTVFCSGRRERLRLSVRKRLLARPGTAVPTARSSAGGDAHGLRLGEHRGGYVPLVRDGDAQWACAVHPGNHAHERRRRQAVRRRAAVRGGIAVDPPGKENRRLVVLPGSVAALHLGTRRHPLAGNAHVPGLVLQREPDVLHSFHPDQAAVTNQLILSSGVTNRQACSGRCSIALDPSEGQLRTHGQPAVELVLQRRPRSMHNATQVPARTSSPRPAAGLAFHRGFFCRRAC